MMPEFDLIVLGGGTGGLPSAIMAASMGKKVAIIEKDKLAGTCLNYGCTPTKSIIHSAELFSIIKEAHRFGIEFDNLQLNFEKIMQRTHDIVSDALKRNEDKVAQNENITLFSDTGRFINEKEIQARGETIPANHIFIATGTSPPCQSA